MLTTPVWIAHPLASSQAVARRNAAQAVAICAQRRREREDAEHFVQAYVEQQDARGQD